MWLEKEKKESVVVSFASSSSKFLPLFDDFMMTAYEIKERQNSFCLSADDLDDDVSDHHDEDYSHVKKKPCSNDNRDKNPLKPLDKKDRDTTMPMGLEEQSSWPKGQ